MDLKTRNPTGCRAAAGDMQMTSPRKISFHRERLDAFLSGEPVFPVTVEMDITTYCPRKCRECPSTRSPAARHFALADIDMFFSNLEGQTRGLLLSGGEPTASPDLPAFLKLARRRGFEEIAIVSGGFHLDEEATRAALLEDVTVIRVSLYDWNDEIARKQGTVLRKIEALRNRIEAVGSGLHIGVSALTTRENIPVLGAVVAAVEAAGAHWIYFHPLCSGWGSGRLSQTSQDGVPEEIERLQAAARGGFGVCFCPARYRDAELVFSEYYSAHFLMVVGADGVNYLGTETKYQEEYAIASSVTDPGFLWRPERLNRIRSFNYHNYPPLGGRHRGLLYNHHLEQLRQGGALPAAEPDGRYLYPHIL